MDPFNPLVEVFVFELEFVDHATSIDVIAISFDAAVDYIERTYPDALSWHH